MTSAPGVEEIERLRSFRKTAIVLMLLLRLDRPAGEGEIAGLLAMAPNTVRRYLRSLARSGVVTRTHRYQGWTLTAGGRQLVLGESNPTLLAEHVPPDRPAEENSQEIKTSVKNCRSRSIAETGSGASVKNPRSRQAMPRSSVKNCRSSVKNCRSSVKNCRSRPLAAASLSLSFKEESNQAAAATQEASVKNSRSSGIISRSLAGRCAYRSKDGAKASGEMAQPASRLQANLEAFAAIGVTKNDFVLEICKLKHVNPRFILGQKKRLESERRYSAGLLLTVIRCKDHLPEKYLPTKDPDWPPDTAETESDREDQAEPVAEIEPDPSIHETISENGMTAMKAWSAALGQLKTDIPRTSYEQWVRDSILLSAKDGIFLIGAGNEYAREWMTSRLTSTITRLLIGICNQVVEVKFVNILGSNIEAWLH